MAVTTTLTLVDADRSYTVLGQTKVRAVEFTVHAPDAPGTYAVIVWSHGHFGGPTGEGAYTPRMLADLGYIVVAPTHLDSLRHPDQGSLVNDRFPSDDRQSAIQRVEDMRFALDSFATLQAALNARAGGGYLGDLTRVTAAGHSHGAWTAAVLTGVRSGRTDLPDFADARFTTAMLYSPQGVLEPGSWHGFYYNSPTDHSWLNSVVPTLIITGTDDGLVVPGGNGDKTYHDRLDGFSLSPSGDRHAVVIRGADHGEVVGSADAMVAAAARAAAEAFLAAYVRGDAAALARLSDAGGWQAAWPQVSEVYSRTTDGAAGLGVIRGTDAADEIEGLSSGDTVAGLDGADQINGAGGDDLLFGGGGDDVMTGGDGADLLNGESGSDRLEGGAGGDVLSGESGTDQLLGGEGGDLLLGGPGDDVLSGESGDDVLFGEADADRLEGGDGFDIVNGMSGEDALYGQGGVDVISGEDGADLIVGGAGADVLIGGAGADRFVVAALSDSQFGDGGDLVVDFQPGVDRIDLTAVDANTVAAGDQAFVFVAAFTGVAGQATLTYDAAAGRTVLSGDVDGDGRADLVLSLLGEVGASAGFLL